MKQEEARKKMKEEEGDLNHVQPTQTESNTIRRFDLNKPYDEEEDQSKNVYRIYDINSNSTREFDLNKTFYYDVGDHPQILLHHT
ncbi:unnamed protein product [Arabidopsis halleri]